MATLRSNFAAEVNVFNTMLIRNVNEGTFIHSMFASPEVSADIPGNAGTDIAQWNRVPEISVSTTPIAENASPTPEALQKAIVNKQLSLYGKVVGYTETVETESILNIPDIANGKVMENYMRTMDGIVADSLAVITVASNDAGNNLKNVYYPGNKTAVNTITAGAEDNATIDKMNSAIIQLRNDKAELIMPPVPANPGQLTSPLSASYVCLCGSAVADLFAAQGAKFVPAAKYGVMPANITLNSYYFEVGAYIHNSITTRIFTTLNPYDRTIGASSAHVGAAFFLGKEAFGISHMNPTRVALRIVNSPDSGNTLGLNRSVGWRAKFASSIINRRSISAVFSNSI